MTHFVIMAKSFNINEAGNEYLEDAGVLSVQPTLQAAMKKVDEISASYSTDDFIVEDAKTVEDNYGIIITSQDRDPGFKIYIYIEDVEDDEEN